MIERTGNLFDTDAPGIGHGVNCSGVMGAGIAVEFKRRWPDMFEEYRRLCEGHLVPGQVFAWRDDESCMWVFNLASQPTPGRTARLGLVEQAAMTTLRQAAAYELDRVAIPWIGCGIGGLSVDDVRVVLQAVEERSGTGTQFEVWTYAP